jgi:Tol biopolymer transport system component
MGGGDKGQLYGSPRVSPDGRRVAVEITSRGSATWVDVWVFDLASGVLSRLTSQAESAHPEWTPDGKRIAYISNRNGRDEVWWAPADGSGPEERLYTMPDSNDISISEVTFSPDGQFAVLRAVNPRTGRDLWLLRLGGGGGGTRARKAAPLLQTGFDELTPRVSPSGRWLAYVSNETGQFEVYVRAFPGPGGRVQVSSGGGSEPVWAPNGRLIYRSGGRFMAATLAMVPSRPADLTVARREMLFEDRASANDPYHQQYDVLPNGWLAVLRPAAEEPEIVLVLNWLTELRARMAAGSERSR